MFWKVCTKWRIRESDQLKTVLDLDGMEFHQKISRLDYQKLKRSIDQKLRLRKFDAIERGQGVCYQWKAKGQCSRGYQCSFGHDGYEHAKSTPKTAPSSEPPTPRGRIGLIKRSLRGRSPSGKTNRQPCKDILKGICMRLLVPISILTHVNFVSLKLVANSAQSSRFRTGRLRNNQIQSRRRVVTKVQYPS